VFEQSYVDYEIIVVDDHSTDNTVKIIKKFKDVRLKAIFREQSGGGAAARNSGLAVAKGKYIAFLDDDDEWFPDKLRLQLDKFEQEREAALVYTGAFHVLQKDNRILKVVIPEKRGDVYQDLLLENFIGTTSSIMVRREALEQIGFFDPALPACQDWDLCLRIARKFPVDVVSAPLLRFYIHPVRITHNLTSRISGKEFIFNKYSFDIQRDRKVLGKHRQVMGRLLCHDGQMRRGRQLLLLALRATPFNLMVWKHLLGSFCGAYFYQRILKFKRKLCNTNS
jgi:glycosyltransferase involved in cell wall biosynthesis